MLLFVAALTAATVSLIFNSSWLHVVPFAVFMTLCLIGLFFQARRFADLRHEIKLQVILSITVYFAVICAACGYELAANCGPSIGAARTVALYVASRIACSHLRSTIQFSARALYHGGWVSFGCFDPKISIVGGVVAKCYRLISMA
jgi:hypothetical protein